MEYVEPKAGDRIVHRDTITTIDSFSEDDGTFLRNGQWVCISDFEKNQDGVWQRKSAPLTYEIGEHYKASSLRKGVAVIRPAVFSGGVSGKDKVVTTSPCCQLYMRRLDFGDLTSDLAARSGGWSEQCSSCKAHYKVMLVFTGSPRLGLYGVRWESMGF
jgi:hypothetical protein